MKSLLCKMFAVGALSIALFGCKSETANQTNGNSASSGGAAANTVNTTAPSNSAPNTNAVSATNTNANTKPLNASPKRIAFNKGANWGAVNITLAPGAAQRFVVGAKSGQTMEVEASSKETSVNLVKGKAETTEDFGFLNAVLRSNGDYVFEVKNGSKREIKTSVKVTINGGDSKSDPTYEEPVLDDDEPSGSN